MATSSKALSTTKPSTTAAIDAHAHGDEEQAQQKALERLEVGLELAPVLALGQQHAGEEGAERHRQPHGLHQRRRGHHQQQAGGGEDLGRSALRDPAQRWPQQQTAAEDDGRHHAHGLGGRHPAAVTRGMRRLHRQQRQQRDDDDAAQVLEQRHAQDAAAAGGGHQVALGQRGQRDGRGALRQRQARHQRQPPVQPRGQRHGGHQRGGAEELHAAPPEDRPPQRPQPLGLQLQAHQEQHQHDTELGEVQDVGRVRHQLQHVGADQDAGGQVADDRAQAQQPRQRHGHHGGAQEDEAVLQPGG
jgi:hypothetical protein